MKQLSLIFFLWVGLANRSIAQPIGPTDTALTCGDGLRSPQEICDDGNNLSGDGCRLDCLGKELCGDGLIDLGEECDDPNTSEGGLCSHQCSLLKQAITGAPIESLPILPPPENNLPSAWQERISIGFSFGTMGVRRDAHEFAPGYELHTALQFGKKRSAALQVNLLRLGQSFCDIDCAKLTFGSMEAKYTVKQLVWAKAGIGFFQGKGSHPVGLPEEPIEGLGRHIALGITQPNPKHKHRYSFQTGITKLQGEQLVRLGGEPLTREVNYLLVSFLLSVDWAFL